MVLQGLANVCSHLQNASRARLALTSIPSTKHNLALSTALQSAGFLSTVVRAGPQPPPLLSPTHQPHASDPALADEAIVTQENVSTRRLWLGLKYWNQYPVISEAKMISTPKQRVTLKWKDLSKVVRGGPAHPVRGLTKTGECIFVLTDRGILEARKCVEEQVGGMVICRVS